MEAMAERKKTKQAGSSRKTAPRAKAAAAGPAKPRAGAAGAPAAGKARAAVAAALRKGKAVREDVEAKGAAAGARAAKAARAAKTAAKEAVAGAAGAVAEAAGTAVARARKAVAKARGLAARPPKAPARARAGTQPDPESYFVARVRGEEAVREAPHPMTEAAVEAAGGGRPAEEPAGAWDEQLGDLPSSYGDDVLIALPRDPRTLFVYWEHLPETVRRGFEGLQGGKAELWIFVKSEGGGWERARVVDLALESRSWYVHDLEPGRTYRAEIHLVDAREDRLLPRPSNEMQLPPSGPSPVVDDRYARLRWEEHLARWLAEWRQGGPFAEELRRQLLSLSDWSRFAGETWGGARAGGMGGRPSSPAGPPGSPSGPPGSRGGER